MIGIDIDEAALLTCTSNVEQFEDLPVSLELVQVFTLYHSTHQKGVQILAMSKVSISKALRDVIAQVDLVLCSIADLERLRLRHIDTVIMNPPFGTRKKGADLDFLRVALKVSSFSVVPFPNRSRIVR